MTRSSSLLKSSKVIMFGRNRRVFLTLTTTRNCLENINKSESTHLSASLAVAGSARCGLRKSNQSSSRQKLKSNFPSMSKLTKTPLSRKREYENKRADTQTFCRLSTRTSGYEMTSLKSTGTIQVETTDTERGMTIPLTIQSTMHGQPIGKIGGMSWESQANHDEYVQKRSNSRGWLFAFCEYPPQLATAQRNVRSSRLQATLFWSFPNLSPTLSQAKLETCIPSPYSRAF